MDYLSEGKITRRSVIVKSAPECQTSFQTGLHGPTRGNEPWMARDFPVACCPVEVY